MKHLILHEQTRKALEQLLATRPHAIMLTGNEGSGKRHVARNLAEALLEASLENHPYFVHVEPAGKSFTIDQIRELQKAMKLKTTGSNQVRRVAIMQDVHTMTVEAQNALLKLLEEPPEDTVLILTAQGDAALKPTIYSRVQRVHIKPVLITDVSGNWAKHPELTKMHNLSGGDVGLLVSLLSDNNEHQLVRAIDKAKKLITEPPFARLTKVDELGKDKDELANILVALKRIASAALKSAVQKQDAKNKRRWMHILQNVHQTEGMLQTNVNTKLLLTELFLSF